MIRYTVVCFSSARWNTPFQRTQHLMKRFARQTRVIYVEEPVAGANETPYCISHYLDYTDLVVVLPQIPPLKGKLETTSILRELLAEFLISHLVHNYVLWYDNEHPYSYTDHLHPLLTVWDVNRNSSKESESRTRLLKNTDMLFTNSPTWYQHNREKLSAVFLFPDALDKAHVKSTGSIKKENGLPKEVQLGCITFVDEPIDIAIISELAKLKPDWKFVFAQAKREEHRVPLPANVHFLGPVSSEQLAQQVRTWKIAIMPLLIDQRTQYIGMNTAMEYIAMGKKVISTPIPDMIVLASQTGMVYIAKDAQQFIQAAEEILMENEENGEEIHYFLNDKTWDNTWNDMQQLMGKCIELKRKETNPGA